MKSVICVLRMNGYLKDCEAQSNCNRVLFTEALVVSWCERRAHLWLMTNIFRRNEYHVRGLETTVVKFIATILVQRIVKHGQQ